MRTSTKPISAVRQSMWAGGPQPLTVKPPLPCMAAQAECLHLPALESLLRPGDATTRSSVVRISPFIKPRPYGIAADSLDLYCLAIPGLRPGDAVVRSSTVRISPFIKPRPYGHAADSLDFYRLCIANLAPGSAFIEYNQTPVTVKPPRPLLVDQSIPPQGVYPPAGDSLTEWSTAPVVVVVANPYLRGLMAVESCPVPWPQPGSTFAESGVVPIPFEKPPPVLVSVQAVPCPFPEPGASFAVHGPTPQTVKPPLPLQSSQAVPCPFPEAWAVLAVHGPVPLTVKTPLPLASFQVVPCPIPLDGTAYGHVGPTPQTVKTPSPVQSSQVVPCPFPEAWLTVAPARGPVPRVVKTPLPLGSWQTVPCPISLDGTAYTHVAMPIAAQPLNVKPYGSWVVASEPIMPHEGWTMMFSGFWRESISQPPVLDGTAHVFDVHRNRAYDVKREPRLHDVPRKRKFDVTDNLP